MAFLITIEIPNLTGVAKDTITNQWAVAGGDPEDPASYVASLAAVVDFYTETNTTTASAIGEYLSPVLSRAANACTGTIYDITDHLDGSPHGSPLAIETFTLDTAGASPAIPSEVAGVLRLEAIGRSEAMSEAPDSGDPGTATDRPKQRRTGRVYIGPLAQTSLVVTSGVPRISNGFRDTMIYNAKKTNDSLISLAGGEVLGVWSRKDAVVRAVEAFAVDNAFDTQRRRGESATALTRVSA